MEQKEDFLLGLYRNDTRAIELAFATSEGSWIEGFSQAFA